MSLAEYEQERIKGGHEFPTRAVKSLYIDPPYRTGENNMVSGIGEKTFSTIKQQIEDLIITHKRGIQRAFSAAEDCRLKVGVNINIQRVAEKVLVETGITYVVERINDKQSGFVDENQVLMFDKAANDK